MMHNPDIRQELPIFGSRTRETFLKHVQRHPAAPIRPLSYLYTVLSEVEAGLKALTTAECHCAGSSPSEPITV